MTDMLDRIIAATLRLVVNRLVVNRPAKKPRRADKIAFPDRTLARYSKRYGGSQH